MRYLLGAYLQRLISVNTLLTNPGPKFKLSTRHVTVFYRVNAVLRQARPKVFRERLFKKKKAQDTSLMGRNYLWV